MKEKLNKNFKFSFAILCGVYIIFSIVNAILAKGIGVMTIFNFIALIALCVYVFFLSDKKLMSLVVTGAFLIFFVGSIIDFVNACKAFKGAQDFYVVIVILRFLSTLVLFPLWGFNVFTSLKAFDFNLGPIQAKKVPTIQAIIFFVVLAVTFIYSIVMNIKYDAKAVVFIINIIAVLIDIAFWVGIILFVNNAEMKEIKFSEGEKKSEE